MKSVAIILLAVALPLISLGQTNHFVNAKLSFEGKKIEEAKSHIDKVDASSKIAQEAKFWKLKGDIYLAHYKEKDGGIKNQKTLKELLGFYTKCNELDERNSFAKEIERDWSISQNMFLNSGVQLYNEKKYGEAYTVFLMTIDVAEFRDVVDTLAIYNAGLAAERNGNYPDAIRWYNTCVDLDYKGANTCAFVIYLYRKTGDEQEEKKALTKCRAKYPNDYNLLVTELNAALRNGENEKAVDLLNKSIEINPSDPVLHFSLGTVYDGLNQFEKAEKCYMKAIELNSTYFDAQYSIGALYFNKGVEVNNQAADETDPDKYLALKRDADAFFNKSIEPLEKAHSLKPDDLNTLMSLQQLYGRMGDTDNYNEVKQKIESIGN